jgi:hypothetical protein
MKKVLFILSVFILSNLSYGKTSNFLIGLDVGNGKVSASEIDKSGSKDDTIYSLKIGYISPHQRFLIKGDSAKLKDTVDIKTAFFELDQVFSIVYIGLNLGYISYDEENVINKSGLLYGVQAGIIYELNSFIELEGSIRYSLTSISKDNFDVDSWRVISAGLNIKF